MKEFYLQWALSQCSFFFRKKKKDKERSKIVDQIVSSKKQEEEEEKKRALDKRTPAQLAYEKTQEKRVSVLRGKGPLKRVWVKRKLIKCKNDPWQNNNNQCSLFIL